MHQCTDATTAVFAMMRCKRAAWFALVHFCIGAFSAAALSAETIDRVLAIVAGQLITLSDVTAARELGLEGAASQTGADPVRAVLNTLIDRELVLAEVERYAPSEPLPEAIDREAARVRARFGSADAFAAALARAGLDERDLREILRQDLRIAAYLDQRFTAAETRRQTLVDDWLAGLRNRGEIVDLYLTRN
jgi:hypothetical protein